MSIQAQIDRLSSNVAAALEAIAAKGVEVPAGSTSDDLAELIMLIVPAETVATIVINGAVDETISWSGEASGSVSFDDGKCSAAGIALKPGNYVFTGSVSGYSKTVTLTEDTTVVSVYPDTAIFWYGNGDAEGDSLYTKCYGFTGYGWAYAGSGSCTVPTISTQRNYAQGSITGVGSSSGYYGTVSMNYPIDVSGLNTLHVVSCRSAYNGSAVSRVGVVSGSSFSSGYTFHKSADITSTSKVTTSLDVSGLTTCRFVNALWAAYYGGSGAVYSQIWAIY